MSEEKQIATLVGLDLILSPEHYKEITKLQQENKQLKEDKKKAIEEIETIKQHYEELRKSPFEDSVFLTDMLRQSFILSVESYLELILEILGDKENE